MLRWVDSWFFFFLPNWPQVVDYCGAINDGCASHLVLLEMFLLNTDTCWTKFLDACMPGFICSLLGFMIFYFFYIINIISLYLDYPDHVQIMYIDQWTLPLHISFILFCFLHFYHWMLDFFYCLFIAYIFSICFSGNVVKQCKIRG